MTTDSVTIWVHYSEDALFRNPYMNLWNSGPFYQPPANWLRKIPAYFWDKVLLPRFIWYRCLCRNSKLTCTSKVFISF